MSLFVFGGGAINDFAFTFLIGIITGDILEHLHRERDLCCSGIKGNG